MPVDLSMFEKPDTDPLPNPLAQLTQLQGLQHGAMQNQLLQRTMAAQMARGRAYAANTDAQGNVNAGGAMAAMAQDPNAQPDLDEAAQANQAFSQAQLTQHMQMLDKSNQILGSALKLATNADGTPNPKALEGESGDSILKSVGDELHGILPDDIIASQLSALPKDGAGRYAALTQHIVAGMQASQQVGAIYGQLHGVDDGQNIHQFRVPDVAGSAPATIEKQTSPEFDHTPRVQTNNATGAQTYTTTEAIANAPPGTIGAGQPTQLQHEQASAGGASGNIGATREAAIQGEMPQLMANRASFRSLTADINNGMFHGPSADNALSISRWAQTLGFNVDPKTIANTEDATKALARIVSNTPGATHSDQLNAQAIAQNPSLSKSPEGFARLVAMAQGYNDARLATVNGIRSFRAANPSWPAAQIPALEGEITKRNSVSLFQYNALPDQYKHTMTDKMPDATAFINKYNKAKASGLFSKGLGE